MPALNKVRDSQFKKGFTLIELLVVIAIIGILATFVVASFNSAQVRARDSRRKSDLDAIKKALELSKQDTPGATYYPLCDLGANCVPGGAPDRFNPDLASAYIKTTPLDPKSTSPFLYNYEPQPAGCNNVATLCRDYNLRACLENPNDNSQNPPPAAFAPCNVATVKTYLITAP